MSVKTVATQNLVLTGDNIRFRELLKLRLVECGWRDQVKLLCRQVIRDNDDTNITVDRLASEITPKARALVPDTVKKELLHKIKSQLLAEENLDNDVEESK